MPDKGVGGGAGFICCRAQGRQTRATIHDSIEQRQPMIGPETDIAIHRDLAGVASEMRRRTTEGVLRASDLNRTSSQDFLAQVLWHS